MVHTNYIIIISLAMQLDYDYDYSMAIGPSLVNQTAFFLLYSGGNIKKKAVWFTRLYVAIGPAAGWPF